MKHSSFTQPGWTVDRNTCVPYVSEGLTRWTLGWSSDLTDWCNTAYVVSLVLFVMCFFRMRLDTPSGTTARLFFPVGHCFHSIIQKKVCTSRESKEKWQSRKELRPVAQTASQKWQHIENNVLKVTERTFPEDRWVESLIKLKTIKGAEIKFEKDCLHSCFGGTESAEVYRT